MICCNSSLNRGLKLWLSAALPSQPINLDIALTPLENVLRKLLTDNSFALVYGADGMVSTVYVLPKGDQLPLCQTIDAKPADLGEQILQDALALNLLTDHMKATMLKEFHDDEEALQHAVTVQRPAALEKLIESLR